MKPKDYSWRRVTTADPQFVAYDIRDGLGKWTAQLRIDPNAARWKLIIQDGNWAHSLRMIDSYEGWLRWLAERA